MKFKTLAYVFPAHAGMFLPHAPTGVVGGGFPRARGDVPYTKRCKQESNLFSPRTRGCSGIKNRSRFFGNVFPAHAGMFLPWKPWILITKRFPRARGDVPLTLGKFTQMLLFSPRTRGCSVGVGSVLL